MLALWDLDFIGHRVQRRTAYWISNKHDRLQVLLLLH